MKEFITYWFVAVPKLTWAQCLVLFYRFIRFVAEEYTERGWYNDRDEEDDKDL
ncbi:MAG: hypothetical protein ACWGQW_18970 [bacterium]